MGRVFLLLCGAFLGGVATAYVISFDWLMLYISFLIACVLAMWLWRMVGYRTMALCAIFFIFGISVAQLDPVLSGFSDGLVGYHDVGWRSFEGVIVGEPDVRQDHQKLTVLVQALEEGDEWVSVSGKVLVNTDLYPSYDYGDVVRVTCTLREPFETEDFSYKDYLARFGISSVCYGARVYGLDHRPVNMVMAGIFGLKKWFLRGVSVAFVEPHASLLGGLLIGERSGFPDWVVESFSRAGLTHIVAISGYNITLLIVIGYTILLRLGVPRKRGFWLIVSGIAVFTIMTGATSATVRASIMGCMVLFAQHMGRSLQVGRSLVIAATIMVALSPSILLFDVGFQLSFLATMGLVYISPLFEPYFKWVPAVAGMREVIVQTLSAIVVTSPLIVYQFQQFSVVALVANLFVLPPLPFIMLTGFMVVVLVLSLSAVGISFSGWLLVLSWPTWLALEYVLRAAEWFAHVPGALVPVRLGSWDWVFLAGVYGGLAFWVWAAKKLGDRNEEEAGLLVIGGRVS